MGTILSCLDNQSKMMNGKHSNYPLLSLLSLSNENFNLVLLKICVEDTLQQQS